MHEYGDSGRREIALTFDVGSDRGYTEEVLDFLDERNIQVSFGVTGMWAEANPDLVQRIVDDGHLVMNHSWSHCSFTGENRPECQLTSAERQEEILRTQDLIAELTDGYDTAPYFRPPYGDISDDALVDIGATGHYIVAMWTVDSNGWRGWEPEQVIQRCLDAARPGAIILMHLGSDGTDQDALPGLVEQLTDDGYAFVTVEEVLQP